MLLQFKLRRLLHSPHNLPLFFPPSQSVITLSQYSFLQTHKTSSSVFASDTNMDPGEEINETNNISPEIFMKFVTALKEFKSKAATVRIDEAIQPILQIFNSLPSVAMENEISSCISSVPVNPDVLYFTMLDMNCWALSLSSIVHLVSSNDPPSIFQLLSNSDTTIKKILMINADLQLPTPFVQSQSFNFYRFLTEIDDKTWVIFDISTEYFLHTSDGSLGHNVWRRRSGVIFKQSKDGSQVLWVENVQAPAHQLQAPAHQLQANMYSGLMNSKMGFSAKRWLSTLKWWFDRSHSILETKKKMNLKAHTPLLKLADKMKIVFLASVSATPDDRYWDTLPDQNDIRVMRSRIDYKNFYIPGTYSYTAVKTFRLEITPTEAAKFLTRHIVEIQWSLPEESGCDLMVKYYSKSNLISLFKRGIYDNTKCAEKPKHDEYLLQETSKDSLCYFIVAAPLTERDVYSSLFFGIERDVMLWPTGFAILPEGLNSKTSLVTIVMQRLVSILDAECDAIEPMKFSINNRIKCVKTQIEQEAAKLKNAEPRDD